MLDERLTPLERNAWLTFRALASSDGTVVLSYDALRKYLPSVPGSKRAALETVSRAPRHVYDGQCKAAGLSNMHGLRHRYARMRYEMLTGWKAPAAGSPGKAQLSSSQRMRDQHARQQISHELGHERLKVTSIYLGI